MNSSSSYVLPAPRFLHASLRWGIPKWLADIDEPDHYRSFTSDDALAASGDCFVTVATRLDKLAQSLEQDSKEQIEIEHIVRSLLYLQDHYAVVAKRKLG
jgi:hypothetical protein